MVPKIGSEATVAAGDGVYLESCADRGQLASMQSKRSSAVIGLLFNALKKKNGCF